MQGRGSEEAWGWEISAFGEPKDRGWSGEQRTRKLPCLPSSAAPSAPHPHLQGKETIERNLDIKWASDSVRAAQALRPAASCTSAPSDP